MGHALPPPPPADSPAASAAILSILVPPFGNTQRKSGGFGVTPMKRELYGMPRRVRMRNPERPPPGADSRGGVFHTRRQQSTQPQGWPRYSPEARCASSSNGIRSLFSASQVSNVCIDGLMDLEKSRLRAPQKTFSKSRLNWNIF